MFRTRVRIRVGCHRPPRPGDRPDARRVPVVVHRPRLREPCPGRPRGRTRRADSPGRLGIRAVRGRPEGGGDARGETAAGRVELHLLPRGGVRRRGAPRPQAGADPRRRRRHGSGSDTSAAFLADPHGREARHHDARPVRGPAGRGRAHEAVEALVHFLATTGRLAEKAPQAPADRRRQGPLQQVGCLACHGPREGEGPGLATSVPLGDLAAKYTDPAPRRLPPRPAQGPPLGPDAGPAC